MKKILIISIIALSTTKLYSQGTTQEEYNYITKGYKAQIEGGLDMKKGYSFIDMGKWSLLTGSEKRNCEFKGLLRDGEKKPCAVMMVFKRTDISEGTTGYICIPSIDAEEAIWQQTLNFLNENFTDELTSSNANSMKTIIWTLMKFSSMEVSK